MTNTRDRQQIFFGYVVIQLIRVDIAPRRYAL